MRRTTITNIPGNRSTIFQHKVTIATSKSSPSLSTVRELEGNLFKGDKRKTNVSFKKPSAEAKRTYKRKILPNYEKGAADIGKPYFILEKGVNVTPKPLFDPEFPSVSETQYAGLPAVKPFTTRAAKQALGASSPRSSAHSLVSRASIIRPSRASFASSMMSLATLGDVSWVSVAPPDADEEVDFEAIQSAKPPSMFRLREDPPPRSAKIKTNFTITLKESDTMIMLDIPSQADSIDTDQGQTILIENKAFTKAKETSKTVSHTATQTTRQFLKHRKLYAPRNTRENSSAWVTVWDIYDTYQEKVRISQVSTATREEGKVDTVEEIIPEVQRYSDEFSPYSSNIDNRMLNSLMIMERLIHKKQFKEKQLCFKGLLVQDPLSLDVKCTYTLKRLWTFCSEQTKLRKVTSMCWSQENENLLAVGYGKFKYTDKCNGLVCIWNVKNPMTPEREFFFEDPVTFVVFSDVRTQILAVTFYSGLVLLIDVTTRSLAIKASNNHYPLYYPVWQARWFPGDNEKVTTLLTCTKNGRIYRYKKSKFFSSRKYMSMGRPHGIIQGIRQPRKCYARSTLSRRHPSAEVLVTHPSDPLLYMVGTSEGCIHLCSINHHHDYIDVFVAHDGPIYNIQFNPFCSKVFLSCGADWCIRIWAETVFEPLITLESGMAPVQDALWDPLNSTVIVSITGTFIEVWDIRRKISTPKSSMESPTKSYNTVLQFSENNYNVCVGDEDGNVHVMVMSEMPFSPSYQEDVLAQSILNMLTTQPELQAKLFRLGHPFGFGDASFNNRMSRKHDQFNKKMSN